MALTDHADPVNSKCLFSATQAKKLISEARRNGKKLIFHQDNPKLDGTRSQWRYEFYKSATSFSEFDELCKKKAEYTDPKGIVELRPKAAKSDLKNDVQRGYLFFVDAAPSAAGTVWDYNSCVFDDTKLKHFGVPTNTGKVLHEKGILDDYLESDEVQSLRQAHGLMDYDSTDVELFAAAKAWWAASNAPSPSEKRYDQALESIGMKRVVSESPVEMPAWFALAAFNKAQVWVDGMKEPISLVEAMKTPDWPKWKASIEKEVMGLVAMDLWDEVPRINVPNGQRVNSGHFVFKIKTEDGKFVKCKSRYVFGGHRSVAGIDFMDTMAHMAALKSVRTVLALAAPAGHYLRNFDISQAFTFSECARDVFMELPPLEMMGINDPKCGRGRRSGFVAKLKRMIYGQKDAGRAWMQLLDKFFHSINAKPTVTDPVVYNWSFNGHESRFDVHVDDILCSCADESVHREISRLLREEFGQDHVTEQETTWILGMKVTHDRERKTINISQGVYARMFLAAFGIDESTKGARTPLPPEPVFTKFTGVASAEDSYRMMVLCGGLQWLQTCTRPDLSFSTNMLARYASNPSPEHIDYANRVLRYLSSNLDMGITYHGSDEVLKSGGYDISNKIIGAVDSDLGGCKDTEKSTTGLVLMLNGGAVLWRSTRQSTVSTGTAEAECKAAGFAGQQLIPLRDLLGELGFV